MHHDANLLAIIAYFIVSWLFAAKAIHQLFTDNQPNPSSQYSCVTKYVLGPPFMLFWGWTGMAICAALAGIVLYAGKYLRLRK